MGVGYFCVSTHDEKRVEIIRTWTTVSKDGTPRYWADIEYDEGLNTHVSETIFMDEADYQRIQGLDTACLQAGRLQRCWEDK